MKKLLNLENIETDQYGNITEWIFRTLARAHYVMFGTAECEWGYRIDLDLYVCPHMSVGATDVNCQIGAWRN